MGNRVLVATTVGPYKVGDDLWESEAWLHNASAMTAVSASAGVDLAFWAALEVDGRGIDHYRHLVERLYTLGGR